MEYRGIGEDIGYAEQIIMGGCGMATATRRSPTTPPLTHPPRI